VTDPQAKAYIKSFTDKKIPLPVSPQVLWPNNNLNRPDFYSNWDFTHLAIVHSGAYGPNAKILSSCEGEYQTCSKQFENTAVASSPDPTFSFPFVFPAPFETPAESTMNEIMRNVIAAASGIGRDIAPVCGCSDGTFLTLLFSRRKFWGCNL
jgi:hypothetical protein